ncbi:MAG: trypsin-like serine protease [Bdellovibrionota bacterium]|nr:MAG: trypsin-like serine protease [Pseudomonadota bacterium]
MKSKSFLALSLITLALSACGSQSSDSSAKIVGGTAVTANNEIAKSTVIMMQNGKTVCSGVLIAPRLVVSAAHCYYLLNKNKPVTIGFGLSEKKVKQVLVEAFVPNAAYDAAAGTQGSTVIPVNDISVLALAEDAPAGYEPVRMLTESDDVDVGETVTLAGFGKTDIKSGWFGTLSGVLYEVDTRVVTLAPQSKEVWLEADAGKGACNGDSGGPAFVRVGGELRLLGVTSRARECKFDFIYTDLRYFQKWIRDTSSNF